MIYSRWRPERGGYDYFESSERFGMGDDLPVPTLPAGSAIGVPSVIAGRSTGAQLVSAGSGAAARGMVMPTSRDGLQGVGPLSGLSALAVLGIGAAGGWVAARFFRKRSA